MQMLSTKSTHYALPNHIQREDDLAAGEQAMVAVALRRREAVETFQNLYKQDEIFEDAKQIEINPLGETADGHILW
ncbi:uncharacterized protein FOMMEDRAFT_155439 [Fomitiporia mediterranea MF3/22]|uniref:uncharacterized protein n=1 Tax=Fomitiporia mediterranea (strain MF3/22) TaxID=694068 RepID=UPI000440786A|nr:uncharacterized protein FOMMEDRAFT_155439 [Fomitiporia mediterranea MF3/22]EJD04312.1 hypothetical protein FOMMEDRAFT_155439 [Fomitiporia mediterranea MF3/22]